MLMQEEATTLDRDDDEPETGRDGREARATVYPDTLEALAAGLEACRLVAEGETVEAGNRDRFVKARTDLRVLRNELERRLDGK